MNGFNILGDQKLWQEVSGLHHFGHFPFTSVSFGYNSKNINKSVTVH